MTLAMRNRIKRLTKVYAMAHIATLLVKMEVDTLTAIKVELQEFRVTGNVEKTSLIQIYTVYL
jgi:hypothetical protein